MRYTKGLRFILSKSLNLMFVLWFRICCTTQQDLYQKSAQLTNLKTLITLLEVSWERTQEQERLVDYALSANAETHFMGIHCIPIEYSDKINNITLFIKTVATNLKVRT
jgi:hypothetical protein